MTVRWTVRAATGFSAEKRIPPSPPNKKAHHRVCFFVCLQSWSRTRAEGSSEQSQAKGARTAESRAVQFFREPQ